MGHLTNEMRLIKSGASDQSEVSLPTSALSLPKASTSALSLRKSSTSALSIPISEVEFLTEVERIGRDHVSMHVFMLRIYSSWSHHRERCRERLIKCGRGV